ncbi:MAG: GNAT family N-acetyltransferase [Nitrospira sp.]|nr:GNAT family N-acetyltransferase [Nitrospira sp.]MBH0180784.1 GNAT family N-acetyltransferase [Nitrospira sp.]
MAMSAPVIVRQAEYADVDALVEFSAAMAQETEGRRLDRDRLRHGTRAVLDTSDRGFFIVAEIRERDRSRLAGQLMVTYEWSDWRNGTFWWMQSVYVDPAWRRQGIYRSMHHHIVEKAKADPAVCGIRLYVEQSNQAAQHVYQRVGLCRSAYLVYEQDFILIPSKHSP